MIGKKTPRYITACFGDSLTFGSVGYSYIKYLRGKTANAMRNEGMNGESLYRMHERLKFYLKSPLSSNTESVIVCIGTNDLLIPFVKNVSPLWFLLMAPQQRFMKCLTDDNDFIQEYEKMINSVLKSGKKLILVGIPHLEMKKYPNKPIDRRNRMIRSLADKYGVPFVDITAVQKGHESGLPAHYSWKYKCVIRLLDDTLFPVFPFMKDVMAFFRGLSYSVDGVHWNSAFARSVAANIGAELKNKQK